MKKIFFKIFFLYALLLLSTDGFSQANSSSKSIYSKFQSADSVVIISHILTKEYYKTTDDWDKIDSAIKLRPLIPPAFLKNGKINPAIINFAKKLSDKDKINLLQILQRKQVTEESKQVMCDLPHHTIIIYKSHLQTYIDICFDCKRIHTSKDISFSEKYFDSEKWTQLKLFFKNQGIAKK